MPKTFANATASAVNASTLTESGQQKLLPDFCDVRVLFILVLLGELLAIVLTLAAANYQNLWETLAFTSMIIQWIVLLDSFLLCHLRWWLNQQSHQRTIIFSFLIMQAVGLCISIACLLLDRYLLQTPQGMALLSLDELFIYRVLLINLAVSIIVLRYLYIQYQWQSNLVAQSHAQIQALRARIRPHFLFNSMNTIASLVEDSPQLAECAIEDLADVFRASLSDQDMNTLAAEIELTEAYLNIERLRLGNRLQVDINIDNTLKNITIPSLTLQPLVENAIYHGIEPIPKGGKISISALQQGGTLVICIHNPRPPATQDSYRKGNQIAQNNIKQRLMLHYANQAQFEINDTKEIYTITIRIPLSADFQSR